MANWDPYHSEALARQIALQREHAWNIDRDIPWPVGIDTNKYLLPLDQDAIAFPGCTSEQRLALSQLLGLVINATISEMESSLKCVRAEAWESVISDFPVNPEMRELGEIFFEEEEKHSRVFQRYLHMFCEAMKIDQESVERLLPKAFGSNFLKRTVENAKSGSHLFWWVVAQVEEVSIKIFQNIDRDRREVDPLFHGVHKRHLEEEARHANYAFLMLELIKERGRSRGFSVRDVFHRKFDLLAAEFWTCSWVVSELSRIFEVRLMASQHPFFATLASILPNLQKKSLLSLFQSLFVTSPYVSLVLNVGNHKRALRMASRHGAYRMPFPEPNPEKTFTKK